MAKRMRDEVGPRASAALPVLWAEMKRRKLNDAALAALVGADSGQIAKILYGLRKPGRALAARFFSQLGIGLELWDSACTVKRRPSDDTELASTGT